MKDYIYYDGLDQELGPDFPKLSSEERKSLMNKEDFEHANHQYFHKFNNSYNTRDNIGLSNKIFSKLKKDYKLISIRGCYIHLISNDSTTHLTLTISYNGKSLTNKYKYILHNITSSTLITTYQTNILYQILTECEIKELPKSTANILIKDMSGYKIHASYIETEKYCESIPLNYGENFLPHNNKIIDSMTNSKTGLYLFHGEPGTGKTTYIKSLTQLVPNKKFVYVPEYMIDSLASPDIIPIFLNNKNNIFILEDSENKLLKRTNNTLLSTILNMTDGILADILQSQFIITFNCPIDQIDPAILRPGRCKYNHEFKKLSIQDAQKLVTSLNGDPNKITEPMSIAEIYNLNSNNETQNLSPSKSKIGF